MNKTNSLLYGAHWLILGLCFSITSNDKQWKNPTNKDVIYMFAPGIWASESQAAYYCQKMHASTGEAIVNHNDFCVMQSDKVVACNFAEVKCKALSSNKYIKLRPWALASALVNFFAPYFIKRSYNNRTISITSSPQQTHTINPFLLKLKNINIGQEKDIKILSTFYDATVHQKPESTIVLYGFSRGAAAAFNFIATQYAFKDIKNIKAIILEGCFDSVIKLKSGLFSKLLSYLLPHYTHQGTEPIRSDILQNFVKICNENHISVLFVTSNADRKVPATNVIRLYQAVNKEGLKESELLILEKSKHSNYVNDPDEKHIYEGAVHTFYEQHGLPYIPYC